jgi:hypothetical protein
MWTYLRKPKDKLYSNKKIFRYSERNWNLMNLNKGISFDLETIKFLCSSFKRRSFLDRLDDYRCEKNYLDMLQENNLDSRITNLSGTISYVMKKKLSKDPIKIQNTHFLFLFKNEEMIYPTKIEKYWLNINERSLKLREKDVIDERIKQLENKMDKFKIWKEKFSNMKLISDILDLPNVKYAIQLKEGSYLIWKFRRKWKMIGEVYMKQNIILTDLKFAKKRKRRKKLNILANLFDVGKHFINNTNIHETLSEENLYPLIKLHFLMHTNNNYFESSHNKKFLFYSQLIERYRNILAINESTYLFLTSSILKSRKEIFKIHILKSRLQNFLSEKKGNINKKKHNLYNSTKIIDQSEATDDLIDGKKFKRSNQEAVEISSSILMRPGMSSNIQGETIPMAYPVSFSRNQRNINEQRSKILNADNSSSNYLDLENNLKSEEIGVNQQSVKPIQIFKQME